MKNTIFAFALSAMSLPSLAQNPIVYHCYTADPAPAVFEGNDSLYVYCDEDMNVPGVNDFYYMERYRVYSTVDMVNWTDHGNAMPRTNFKWAKEGTCWASQCVKYNDKYYWYMCLSKPNDWRHFIGVGMSKTPSGPFKDPKGNHIISTGGGGDIDPTVFIDDDGKAWIYWGNNKLCYAQLNRTMMSAISINNVELTEDAFGGKKVTENEKEVIKGSDCYEEGPWLDKRGDNYYLIYAAGGVPEHISYSMSKSPKGPWEYKGVVMSNQDTGSFTNHSGIVHYKDKDYFFYHSGWAAGGGGFNRSMCVEEMHFNEDGTIQPITATKSGVGPLCAMDPYLRQQAETMNRGEGIQVVGDESTGVYVTNTHSGDYTRLRNLDFGEEGANSITIRVASANTKPVTIYVRKGSKSGSVIARCQITPTGGLDKWEEQTFKTMSTITGKQNLFFVFSGTIDSGSASLANFDWWQFNHDDITAVKEINATTAEKDDAFYDLTGRKVDNLTKGVFIHHGKKMVK